MKLKANSAFTFQGKEIADGQEFDAPKAEALELIHTGVAFAVNSEDTAGEQISPEPKPPIVEEIDHDQKAKAVESTKTTEAPTKRETGLKAEQTKKK